MDREAKRGHVAACCLLPGKQPLQEARLCPHIGEVKHGALVLSCLILGGVESCILAPDGYLRTACEGYSHHITASRVGDLTGLKGGADLEEAVDTELGSSATKQKHQGHRISCQICIGHDPESHRVERCGFIANHFRVQIISSDALHFIYLTCKGILPVCMYVHHAHAVPKEAKGGYKSPGSVVRVVSLHVSAQNPTLVLWKSTQCF